MRITLWQQFSSNHSGGFTLIGVFSSVDAALHAEEELLNIIELVKHWENEGKSGTAEHELHQRYGIRWTKPIKWVFDPENYYVGPVIRLENMVLLDTYSWAFQGPDAFDQLMTRLGAQTVHRDVRNCSDHTDIYLTYTITCAAASSEQAEWVEILFHDSLTDYRMTPLWTIVNMYPDSLPPEVVQLGINQMERRDREVTFRNLCLSAPSEFPNFIQWLRTEGAMEIRCAFTEFHVDR